MYDFLPSHIVVGFDREIFSGNPSLKDLEKYTVKLSAEEKGNRHTHISSENNTTRALRFLDRFVINLGKV
jgi:hypothetical protein